MSLTLKAAAVLFAALSTGGDMTILNDASPAPKCARETRAVTTAESCDPQQCEPPKCADRCDTRCPESKQASCEKAPAPSTTQAALSCARR